MLLIFDWDGTLADSKAHIVHAIQLTIDELGLAARDAKQCAHVIGLGLREAVRQLFNDLGEAKIEQFCASYSHHFLALAETQFKLALFDGVAETLTRLRDAGHTLAIATGKSRRGLNRVLAHGELQSLFEVTRAADETASKPDPLMLREILAESRFCRESAVLIGDTSYDMQMAQSINMRRIAVSYGVHDVETLQSYEPCLVIDRIEELLEWVNV